MHYSPLRARLFAGAGALLLTLGMALPTAAQDATPAATPAALPSSFPITADPGQCLVAPRGVDELLGIWFTPEGTPLAAATPVVGATFVTLPVGPAADEATRQAVIATVGEVFACFAAGDFLRATALFSDDLVRGFGAEPGTTIEEVRAFLALPPTPIEGDMGRIIGISDVMLLEDGRVAAIIMNEVDQTGARLDAAYVLFDREDDRWVADEIVDFLPEGE